MRHSCIKSYNLLGINEMQAMVLLPPRAAVKPPFQSFSQGGCTMRLNILVRIAILLVMLTGAFGSGMHVQAQDAAEVIIRSTTIWDATFNGYVDSSRYERWSLQLDEAASFSITATAVSGNLTPEIHLLDSNGVELAHAAGSLSSSVLTTSQPAGDYFVQVQPQSGAGNYILTIRKTDVPPGGGDPTGAVTVDPASILVGETATVTVRLNSVPPEGYTSAEFTCSYDPLFISVSNFVDAGLFGEDAVMVVHGPADGSFILAIAGSNGRKATSSGPVFTFSVLGLQAGETEIICETRVSTGGELSVIPSSSVTLTILEPMGTLTGTVLAGKPVLVTLFDANDLYSALADENGYFEITAPAGSYTVTATASGFLRAEGSPVLIAGATTNMQTISLLAGDIDGNDVIDQFDAMTIGINYNASTPAAADLNNDGVIDVLDLELLAANYQQTGPLPWQ
jgi:hypothetical protein